MLEKAPRGASRTFSPARSPRSLGLILVSFIVITTLFRWHYLPPASDYYHASYNSHLTQFEVDAIAKGLVPLEAHIISKCPDTRDALRELIIPAMQNVSDKVDFKLSYIGKSTSDDGVECKHGPAECMGNILELCAQEHYPDPKISLGFVMCLTKEYKRIPDRSLVEECALEHTVDMSQLNECATIDDGAHGMEMLRKSVDRSDKLGVTKSATIRLNGEIYCIRDDGEWNDCPNGPGVSNLVEAVERLHAKNQQLSSSSSSPPPS